MGFNGKEGGRVTLANASDWTEEWRDEHPNENKAIFIGKDHIEDILEQTDCKGIRVYFAIKSEEYDIVMVGADSNEDDIIGIIVDTGIPCPSFCGNSNDLNS